MTRVHTGRARSRQSQLSQLSGEQDITAEAFITALTLEDVLMATIIHALLPCLDLFFIYSHVFHKLFSLKKENSRLNCI